MQYVGYALIVTAGLFFIARGVLGAYLDYKHHRKD